MLQQTFDILRIKTISIECMKAPYWIKEYVNGVFVMRYLNKAYEDEYLTPHGITRKQYINKRDKDIWGIDIGKHYHGHDLEAYTSKSEIFFTEFVSTLQGRVERMFMKKYILDEETGREYVVGFRFDKIKL